MTGELTDQQQAIVTRLLLGPATTRDLVRACGADAGYVRATVSRLKQRGYAVENCRRGGSHGGSLYRLVGGVRRCQHAGCVTLLSCSNPGPYCRRHVYLHEPDPDPLDVLIRALEEDCGVQAEVPGQMGMGVGA